jgi:hypothetical protein
VAKPHTSPIVKAASIVRVQRDVMDISSWSGS